MLLIAQSLITHGVIGKAKVRKLQRHESGETSTEFRAVDYIVAAQAHFGMTEQEAGNLTMTKFQMLLATKYPEQERLYSRRVRSSSRMIILPGRQSAWLIQRSPLRRAFCYSGSDFITRSVSRASKSRCPATGVTMVRKNHQIHYRLVYDSWGNKPRRRIHQRGFF
ncbi:Uncharacterised protein [Cronobacter sakazakii]|nr:Uncharacterised protein [Cronobacter sakazakii]